MNNQSKSATIMVVDDTTANLKLLQEMLYAKGYRVLAFPDGRMALNAAAKNPPDLILLDITMPGVNGFEVCESLKANSSLKDIPVLFISALSEVTDKVKAFNAGGVDYLTKPFQTEEVYARVHTHLRLRSMQLELQEHNLHLADLVKEQVAEISDSQRAAIVALAKLAESRDDDTGAHIMRTQTYCQVLAENLRNQSPYADWIDDTFVENIFHSSPLHDIGKVGIPDRILLKPGKLTPEEFESMKTHTVIGANTLESTLRNYPRNVFLKMGISIARFHHEKWDGSGYPEGLIGEQIPLPARIMAIADVYDALRSQRPYKTAFSHETSYTIITEGSGKHFDPAIVKAFVAVEAEFEEIRKQYDDSVVVRR